MHLQVWYLKLSSYDCWTKYKEKVPDMLDPNQNVEATCNSKLKDLFIKFIEGMELWLTQQQF